MEIKEAYEILGSWEWDVKTAAHELVEALMKKPPRNTDCNAEKFCRADCSDCLFSWDLEDNYWE